ncbi:MAG: tannase/feruloyl esterase family alpha/beta hydrolase [Thermoanaerobaculia bacterium]
MWRAWSPAPNRLSPPAGPRKPGAAALAALVGVFLLRGSAGSEVPAAADCRRLLASTDATTSILTAELIPRSGDLPEHCRLEGWIPPAIGFEVRLPTEWNGSFFMAGNGGYLGAYFDQSLGLARGYATASTDTGHRGPSPTFAHDNRPAEIDFGFRAVHLTALAAKRLIEKRYGASPERSYFRGCSTGGRQGLMEAQRFPEDFDGLSIGAPIYDYTLKQLYNASWVAQTLYGDDRAGYVPRRKLEALGTAVYSRCDAIDGLRDGLIDDPRRCDFEPARDLERCAEAEDRNDCFSVSQITAIEKIYNGPGKTLYPGHVKGGEWMTPSATEVGSGLTGGWDVYFTGRLGSSTAGDAVDGDAYGGSGFEAVQLRNARSFFKYLAFKRDRPEFEVLSDLDFAAPPDTRYMAGIMNADDSDLSALHERGGKLLLWHGWADVGLNPLRTIAYFDRVRRRLGARRADQTLRLFMVPGMYHCSGGPGPDRFDDLGALEKWVESGVAPERIIARNTRSGGYAAGRGPGGMAEATQNSETVRSRPLCAYPGAAVYRGAGSIDEAESFDCRVRPIPPGSTRPGASE